MILVAFYSKRSDYLKNRILASQYFINKKIWKFCRKDFEIYIASDDLSCSGYKIYEMDNTLIVGKIYCKNGKFEDRLKENLYGNIEEYIIKQCYGSYLIFNFAKEKLQITRDPVGQLPLFYTKSETDEMYFSNEIAMLHELAATSFEYDWNYLSAFLLHTFITSDSTAFKNISELPHGCMLRIRLPKLDLSTKVIWDPRQFCYQENPFKTYQELEIVEKITSILNAFLGNNKSRLMLDFSGGLDSSSLLLILKHIVLDPKQIYALNMFHPSVASSDEREVALELSQQVGSNFIEFDHSTHPALSPIKGFGLKPNWPTSNLIHLKIEHDIMRLAKELNISNFVSGHGGDHIFLCPPPIESVFDYFSANGVNRIYQHIKQMSVMGRIPVAKIMSTNLKAAIKYYLGINYSRDSIFIEEVPWIDKNVIDTASNIKFHPLFELDMKNILPGKFAQLDNIFTGLSTIKSSLRKINTPIMYPLFSQPMIELSLTIPTFKSYKENYNRYPFRKSVEDKFGHYKNLWRRDKGETTGVTQIGMQENSDYILDLCLNGTLISSGLIDKKYKDALHKAFNDMMGGKPDYLWPIENFIALEIFFQLWK